MLEILGEEEEPEVAVEEDDEPPGRVSFFAEGDDAEERVCGAVWNMFVKDSNSRGFDARTRQQRAASGALFARRQADVATTSTTSTEATMERVKGDDGLTERQRKVIAAWRELTASGKSFSNGDIARLAGITGGSSTSISANVSTVMKRLRDGGFLNAAPTKTAPPPPATPEATKTVRAKKVVTPPPEVIGKATSGRAGGKAAAEARAKRAEVTSDDPILIELRLRREGLAAKLAKLDLAIEAYEAAS